MASPNSRCAASFESCREPSSWLAPGAYKLMLCCATNLLCAKAHSYTGGTQRNELANGASKRGAVAPFFGRPSSEGQLAHLSAHLPSGGCRNSPTSNFPDGNFSQAPLAALAFPTGNSRCAASFESCREPSSWLAPGAYKLMLCRATNLLCAKAHSYTGGTQRNELANGASKRGAAAPFFGRPSSEGQLARPAGLEPATLGLEVGFFQMTKVPDIIGICSLDKAFPALSRFNRRPQIHPGTHQKLHPKLQFCCNLFKDDLDGRNDRIAGR